MREARGSGERGEEREARNRAKPIMYYTRAKAGHYIIPLRDRTPCRCTIHVMSHMFVKKKPESGGIMSEGDKQGELERERERESWMQTNGVNANRAAAKVNNFDRLGKKVRPGTFG